MRKFLEQPPEWPLLLEAGEARASGGGVGEEGGGGERRRKGQQLFVARGGGGGMGKAVFKGAVFRDIPIDARRCMWTRSCCSFLAPPLRFSVGSPDGAGVALSATFLSLSRERR